MPTRTLTMRSIRELYRLKYEAGLAHERIARALSISKGVVAKYVGLAEASGLTTAELLAMSEDELAGRGCGRTGRWCSANIRYGTN